MSSPPRVKRDVPPRLPSKKQRSQSLTPVQSQTQRILNSNEKYQSADGVIQNGPEVPPHVRRLMQIEKCTSVDGISKRGDENKEPNGQTILLFDEKPSSADGIINGTNLRSTSDIMKGLKFTTHSLPRGQESNNNGRAMHSRTSSLNRDDTSLSQCVENKFRENEDGPPPKPLKDRNKEELGQVNRVASYHPSGSDSGNGSGDSAQSSATGEEVQQNRVGVIIKNPRFIPNSFSSVTLKSFTDIDPIVAEEALMAMKIPIIEQNPKFDLELFHTVLLPYNDYRPLDSGTLATFRMMISETSPRVIANHMTRIDIKLLLGEVEDTKNVNPLKCTGIELLMLDHGRQLRKDLIERTQCLKLLVAVTILTCPCDEERAETLNKWIQIAVDAKTAAGNLFGFTALMLGLCMPQVKIHNKY
jgi:SH2 domain-containing protein 3C